MNGTPVEDSQEPGRFSDLDDPDRVDEAELESVDLEGFDEEPPPAAPSAGSGLLDDDSGLFDDDVVLGAGGVVGYAGEDASQDVPPGGDALDGDAGLDGDYGLLGDDALLGGGDSPGFGASDADRAVPTLSAEALAGLGIGFAAPPDQGEASHPPTFNGGIPVIEPGGRIARLRRKIVGLSSRWQRSLNLRVVLTTTVALGGAFALLLLVVIWQIRAGLYEDRVEEILTDAAYRTSLARKTFDASTATTSQEIQRLATGAVEQQVIGTTSGPVGAMIMRSPGQSAAAFSEPTTSIALRELVSVEMRQAVEGTDQYWQAVEIPNASGGTDPGMVVGEPVTLPSAGRYQYYLVYSLAVEESAIRVVMHVLGIAGTVFIFVVGLIVAGVVRSVLRPVKQAALSAERLSDGMLDERMEVRGRDEIARLGRSFNEMAASLQHQIERLAALSALQQRFVSDVSHELRTPLTTVKMAADMIYDARDEFPPQLRRSAELLQTQIDRFDEMLADLLEISRIDAGAAVLDLEDHDLRETAVRVAELTVMLADNRSTEVVVEQPDEPVVAECDVRRIERIIRNLVVNAIEHSEGKPVIMTLASNDTGVAVRVRDHGIGMTKEEAGRVFDRFWRADPARARTTGGTGLGLTISLEDARLHGGTLTATGRPGEGASFLLVLPHTAGATLETLPLDLGELAKDPARTATQPGVSITEVETTRGEDADSTAATTATAGVVPVETGQVPVVEAAAEAPQQSAEESAAELPAGAAKKPEAEAAEEQPAAQPPAATPGLGDIDETPEPTTEKTSEAEASDEAPAEIRGSVLDGREGA